MENLKTSIKKWNETYNLEAWENFYEVMTGNGFVMDCYESFRATFPDVQGIETKEEKVNVIENLKTADKQIVGNFIFSHWRYLTYWCEWGFDVTQERKFFKDLFEVLLCKEK